MSKLPDHHGHNVYYETIGGDKPLLFRGIITEAVHVSVEEESLIGIKKAQTVWTDGKRKGLDKHETVFNAWSRMWLSQWFRTWNIEDLLPGIEVPLLVIQGENDQLWVSNKVSYQVSIFTTDMKSKNVAAMPRLFMDFLFIGFF